MICQFCMFGYFICGGICMYVAYCMYIVYIWLYVWIYL